MALTQKELLSLHNIIVGAVNGAYEVLAAAERRASLEPQTLADEPSRAPSPAPPAPSVPGQPTKLTYSLTEAARHLSLSRATLSRMVRAGTLTTVALGARRVVRAADIDRLLATGHAEGVPRRR